MRTYDNLNFLGDKSILDDTSFKLGIVGSRSIISYSKDILDSLFLELQNFDFCIVSGGMYGVDLYAHNLALKYGLKTIFILPQGIESYQKSYLYNQIKFKSDSKYLFVSSYEATFEPRKYTFLERNKVISQFSDLLLVAQASLKSGSISTANYSFKLKKPVICPPFSLENRQFQGSNFLISKGAEIYLNPESILKFFGIRSKDIDSTILSTLSDSSLSFLEIQKQLEVSTESLQKSLLKLILEGRIFYDGEKYFL